MSPFRFSALAIFALCYLTGKCLSQTASEIAQLTNEVNTCQQDLTTCENACENGGAWNTTRDECECPFDYVGRYCQRHPIDCTDAFEHGHRGEGNIFIQPANSDPFRVRCIFRYGGWTIIERRGLYYRGHSPYTSFNKTRAGYKTPFGLLHREHFIGLDNMHALLSQKPYKASIGIGRAQAYYKHFSIQDEANAYRLHYSEYESWPTVPLADGLGLSSINGKEFCTSDNDCSDCGQNTGSGWWFGTTCTGGNLHLPEVNEIRGQWPNYNAAGTSFNIGHSSYIMVTRMVPSVGTPFRDVLLPVFAAANDDVDELEQSGLLNEPTINVTNELGDLLSPFSSDIGRLSILKDKATVAVSEADGLITKIAGIILSLVSSFSSILRILADVINDLAELLCKAGQLLKNLGEWLIEISKYLSSLGRALIRIGDALICLCNRLKELGQMLIEIADDINKLYRLFRQLGDLMKRLGECICRVGRLIAQLGDWLYEWGMTTFGNFLRRTGMIIDRIGWILHEFGTIFAKLTRALFNKLLGGICDIIKYIGELLKRIGRIIRDFINRILEFPLSSLLGQLILALLRFCGKIAEIMIRIGEILIRLDELLRLIG